MTDDRPIESDMPLVLLWLHRLHVEGSTDPSEEWPLAWAACKSAIREAMQKGIAP
jgi:hypothetical protein